jgi:hypothetical protein
LLDFRGKVAGSTFENPNRAFGLAKATFDAPSVNAVSTSEHLQADYDPITKLDGVVRPAAIPTIGQYIQQMFEFDLSHLGMSLAELKNALRSLTVNWTGNGSGASGYIADPTYAPTLSPVTDGTSTLVGGTPIYVKYTYVSANGETLASAYTTVTPTAGQRIDVAVPTFPTNATSAKIYAGTVQGSETYQGSTSSSATAYQLKGISAGAALPTANTTGLLTNSSTMKVWNNGAWTAIGTPNPNTASSPALVTSTISSSLSNYVDSNQKVYVLVHSTYPASPTVQSTLNTDYVSLTVQLADYVDYVKSNVVKVRKETKEVKLAYPKKSYRSGIEDMIDVFYRFIPYQGTTYGQNPTRSDVLKPPFIFATANGTGGIPLQASGTLDAKKNALNMVIPSSEMDLSAYVPTSYTNNSGINVNGFNPLSVRRFMLDGQHLYTEGLDYTDGIPSVLTNKKAMIVFPWIIQINGELFLAVVYRDKDAFLAGMNNANSSFSKYFRIQGRPLVKGVN